VVCRESLEVPRMDYEPDEEEDVDAAVAGAGDRSASWCRSVAVTVQ